MSEPMKEKYGLTREEYLAKYGSFLYCPERDTLCTCMDGMWMTGCEREVCVRDTEEYKQLQLRIEANRKKREEQERREREEEKTAAPIRDQRNRIKSYTQQQIEEIHRLEEAAAKAYRQNRPKQGDDLFHKAKYLRGELKKFQEAKELR